MSNVECTIVLPDGRESGFFIQPKCLLLKLKENMLHQLGLRVTQVFVSRPREAKRELIGDHKYLAEDHGIRNEDVITLKGEKITMGVGLPDCVKLKVIIIYHTDVSVSQLPLPPPHRGHIQVRKQSPLRTLLTSFHHGFELVPESIAFWDEKGEQKLNLNHTCAEAGLVDGSEFQVRGTYFPISLLGPNGDVLSNPSVGMEEPLTDGQKSLNCADT